MSEPKASRVVKGAFHIHSIFSGDGEISLAEVKQLFAKDGFDFVSVCEHQHDVDMAKYHALVEECHRLSDKSFLMIPGIEFNCYRNHILGIGIDAYRPSVADDDVLPWIKNHRGFAVWAHPKKNEYRLPRHVIEELDGIEIWNSKFDGKYAPRAEVVRYFEERRARCPRLRPFCSVDFHFRTQFRHVAMHCEVHELTVEQILGSLRAGRYFAKTAAFTLTGDRGVEVRGHTLRHAINTANLWIFDRCKQVNRHMKRHRLILPSAVKNLGRRLLS